MRYKKNIIIIFTVAIGILLYIFINNVIFEEESKSFFELFIVSIIAVALYYVINKRLSKK